jgi:hypothetical protein
VTTNFHHNNLIREQELISKDLRGSKCQEENLLIRRKRKRINYTLITWERNFRGISFRYVLNSAVHARERRKFLKLRPSLISSSNCCTLWNVSVNVGDMQLIFEFKFIFCSNLDQIDSKMSTEKRFESFIVPKKIYIFFLSAIFCLF